MYKVPKEKIKEFNKEDYKSVDKFVKRLTTTMKVILVPSFIFSILLYLFVFISLILMFKSFTDEKSINIANDFFNKLDNKSKNKIEILSGDANKKLEELIEKNIQCDMIFIDADKINYINYLKYAEKLVKKCGLIVADNTFLSGAVYLDYLPERVRPTTQKNMKEFNKELADSSKYQTIMLNTEEGLTIALKLF